MYEMVAVLLVVAIVVVGQKSGNIVKVFDVYFVVNVDFADLFEIGNIVVVYLFGYFAEYFVVDCLVD